MSIEEVMNYVAWGVSIIVIAWMVIDALRVEVTYDRDLLVSSVEGEIEKEILSSDEEAALKRHAQAMSATEAEVAREAAAHDQQSSPGGGS
jgi:hypothetical protein